MYARLHNVIQVFANYLSHLVFIQSQQTEGPLVPLASTQFGTEQLSKKCELSSLQSQYNLNADGNNIFVEKDVLSRAKVSDFHDVILMFKVNN